MLVALTRSKRLVYSSTAASPRFFTSARICRHGRFDRIVRLGFEREQRMQLLRKTVVGGVEGADLYSHGVSLIA